MFSKLISGQINWEKATPEQKIEAIGNLPADNPMLEHLVLVDVDPRVREAALKRLDEAAQLRLVGGVKPEDEAVLAACLGERLDGDAIQSADIAAQLVSASTAFRVAFIAHAKNEPLALALVETLEDDAARADVARGRGPIEARAAAARGMRDTTLLEAVAHDTRDKQRRVYRAAHDRIEELGAARESRARAEELCRRLESLLTKHEVTLTAVTTAEREWQSITLSTSIDAAANEALRQRYAALRQHAQSIVQEQAEYWREAERLKADIASLAARIDSDDALEPAVCAGLRQEFDGASAKLERPAFTALPRERTQIRESLASLQERMAILAVESESLASARALIESLRADPASLTPEWRAAFAKSVAIVRPALRAPLEEAAAEARAAIDQSTRQELDARRAQEAQVRAEIEAQLRELEQSLDQGKHLQANEIAKTLKDKIAARAQTAGTRPLPAALEFRVKRCQERLAKMNEWKRYADVQARDALCKEAEALAKRIAAQERDAAPDAGQNADAKTAWPWPRSARPADKTPAAPAWPWPRGEAAPAADHPALPAAAQVSARTAWPWPRSEGSAEATPQSPDNTAPQPKLSPEEIGQAVRDLQQRWQALDKAHGSSSKGLWERFRRACDRAYAPARKHFEQLAKRREENAGKKKGLLDRLVALNAKIAEGADWGRVLHERGELIKAWYEGGTLARKDARDIQQRFDTVSGEIDAKLDARRDAERARRRALIDEAKKIAERPADGASMSAMIALQKKWQESMKGAIRLRAKEDQTLWEEFRASGSALFGKRDAEKAARNAERDAQFKDRQTAIDEMRALAASEDASAVKRGVDAIDARWRTLPWPDRKPSREWEQKFANARAAAMARIGAIRREADEKQRAVTAQRMAVVERAEEALGRGESPDFAAIRAELQGMLAENEKLDARIAARLDALEKGAARGADAWREEALKKQAERDALLLELEIVLNLPSPPALEAERRMRMFKRLAESKNSRLTPPLMADGAAKALEKLLALPLATQGVEPRVQAVSDAVRRRAR